VAGERTVKIKFFGDSKQLARAAERATDKLEKFDRMADNLGKTAGRVAGAVAAMIGPAAVPMITAAAVATAGLGASAVAAVAPLAVFGAVTATTFKELQEGATDVQKITDRIEKYGAQAKVLAAAGKDNTAALKAQAAAQLELKALYATMDPLQRKALQSYKGMTDAWQGFVDSNKPATYGVMARGMALIERVIGRLQPLFDIGRAAAERALTGLERWADGGGIKRFVDYLSRNAGPAIDNFARIGRNLGIFLGGLFGGVTVDGQGFLKFLADASDKLAAFSSGGGLQEWLDSVRANAPAAGAAFLQLAEAAATIAQAVGPLAPISLAIAAALGKIISALPPDLITALVAAWIAYKVAIAAANVVVGVQAGYAKTLAAAQGLAAVKTAAHTVAQKAQAVAVAASNVAQKAAAGVTAAWTAATNLLSAANVRTAASTVAGTVATVASSVAQKAALVATKAMTAAQWLWNAAMTANPIGIVIAAIALLVGGIILLYKNSETARKIIDGAWKGIAAGAQWLWNTIIKPAFAAWLAYMKLLGSIAMWLWKNAIQPAWNGIVAAVQFLWNAYKRYIGFVVDKIRTIASAAASVYNAGRDYFNKLVSYIGGLPGRISRAASGLFNGIKNSFRNAVNFIIDGWNRLSFTLPSINTPFGKIGGTRLDTPNIGRLASGGWAQPGATYTVNERGQELLTMGRRPGYVSSAADTAAMTAPPEIHVFIGDRELTDLVDVRIVERDRGVKRRAGQWGLTG
jgi:hypothetical protein